ncbi:MAG: hypothetical protein IJ359_01245 [Erysipelotrichaceae bacterium]|nr:hypothetical protein [Erysipelotrichaceae bacterium]
MQRKKLKRIKRKVAQRSGESIKYAMLPKECGKISIEIDMLTPCLKRLSDGKFVDTYFVEGIPSKKELLDWEFDWNQEINNGHTIMQLYVQGDSRIQGLISTRIRHDIHAIEVSLVEAAPMNNPHNKNYVKKEYEGIGGHLFAEAIRQSYDAQFDGFIVFIAKSKLVEYYKRELGAIQIGKSQQMFIDERKSRELYDKYFIKK